MRILTIGLVVLCLGGCAEIVPEPYEPSANHINTEDAVEQTDIPELVQQAPVLPEPEPPVELEKYTVVVNEVPVNELLFALARDARINIDIDPRISGAVTINAVDQTLPQLLDRIARQVDLRYEFRQETLIISPDEPFFRTYMVNYLNMSRETSSTISTDTGVGGTEGSSTSTANVTNTTSNRLWRNLVTGVNAIIGEAGVTGGSGSGGGSEDEIPVTNDVIPLPESGLLTVRATDSEHELIQNFIDNALTSAYRQVVIQATVLEVNLSDDFQAGIDWSFVNNELVGKAGFDFISRTLTGGPANTNSSFAINYVDPNQDREEVLTASIRLLEEFGNVRVLSSPQIMALNNQTSILKVVDNIVYFEVDVEPGSVNSQGTGEPAVDTTAKTVPVGIVMSITPQVNENDSIILQVRPTISRLIRFVDDPNPELRDQDIRNQVPEIQTREMESVLRLNNGQIAILGGLMQDSSSDLDSAIPGFSRVPGLGEAFKTRNREYSKTELVIFLRPSVIRTPSLDGDLRSYRSFLDRYTLPAAGSQTEGAIR